jgi:hypothetical protein
MCVVRTYVHGYSPCTYTCQGARTCVRTCYARNTLTGPHPLRPSIHQQWAAGPGSWTNNAFRRYEMVAAACSHVHVVESWYTYYGAYHTRVTRTRPPVNVHRGGQVAPRAAGTGTGLPPPLPPLPAPARPLRTCVRWYTCTYSSTRAHVCPFPNRKL